MYRLTMAVCPRGMSLEDWKNAGAVFQSFVTAVGIVLGGIWAYRRYVRQEENAPFIDFSADLNFIGRQSGWWIVEIASIENKGKVPHRMSEFEFDAIYGADQILLEPHWANQVNFGHALARGSFLPQSYTSFFVPPTVRATYSHVTRVPPEASFLMLHCRFKYPDTIFDRVRNIIPWFRRSRRHVAEKTVKIPDDLTVLGSAR
jgi:hypothetical protein